MPTIEQTYYAASGLDSRSRLDGLENHPTRKPEPGSQPIESASSRAPTCETNTAELTAIVASALDVLREQNTHWCLLSVAAIGLVAIAARDDAAVAVVRDAAQRARAMEPYYAPTLDTLDRYLAVIDGRDEAPAPGDGGDPERDFRGLDIEPELPF
jgi:hypothetical protein